jgi:hypothetical protein
MEALFLEGSYFFHADIQKWKIPPGRRKEILVRNNHELTCKELPDGIFGYPDQNNTKKVWKSI